MEVLIIFAEEEKKDFHFSSSSFFSPSCEQEDSKENFLRQEIENKQAKLFVCEEKCEKFSFRSFSGEEQFRTNSTHKWDHIFPSQKKNKTSEIQCDCV